MKRKITLLLTALILLNNINAFAKNVSDENISETITFVLKEDKLQQEGEAKATTWKIWINVNEIGISPILYRNTNYFPIKDIGDAFYANVGWNAENKVVIIEKMTFVWNYLRDIIKVLQ